MKFWLSKKCRSIKKKGGPPKSEVKFSGGIISGSLRSVEWCTQMWSTIIGYIKYLCQLNFFSDPQQPYYRNRNPSGYSVTSPPPKVPLVKSKIIFGKPFFQKKFLPPTPIPYIYWKYISKPGFLEKNENEFNNISIRFPSELDQVEKSRIYKVKIFFVVYIS